MMPSGQHQMALVMTPQGLVPAGGAYGMYAAAQAQVSGSRVAGVQPQQQQPQQQIPQQPANAGAGDGYSGLGLDFDLCTRICAPTPYRPTHMARCILF